MRARRVRSRGKTKQVVAKAKRLVRRLAKTVRRVRVKARRRASPRRRLTRAGARARSVVTPSTVRVTPVEGTKFSTPDIPARAQTSTGPLTVIPTQYGRDRIVLMARDPQCLFTYWEVMTTTRARLEREGGRPWELLRRVLRLYDVTGGGEPSAPCRADMDLPPLADSWYLESVEPEREFVVECGVVAADGTFHRLARSNRVRTPQRGPSAQTAGHPAWQIPDQAFERLYALTGAGARTSGSR